MPRRKAVNPQPLKRPQEKSQVSKNKGEKKTRPFYSDNNTVETTRQTRSSLKRRYRKHKQASPIAGPPRSKKKMTDTEATQPKSPPESDPTSQEVTSKEATGHQKMIVSETAPVCEVPSVDQAGDTGVQRNLSLEALFQVTHSELENISRQRPAAPPIVAPPSPIGPRLAAPVPHSIVIANSTNMKQKDSESGQEDEDVLHIVVSSDDGEAHLMPVTQQEAPEVTEMDITHADSCGVEDDANLQSIVKIPVSEKGVEKYQLKSDTLEEQGLKLIYTKKTFDQYEPNPISYGTYKPRSFKATSQVVDPNLQESGAVQVGRKRKHPQKPGRHICPYCGRGCAKPSVLQKHIRAHTGERPYPCIPCGFSFKTKSNLYKHCKSRAHAVKAGLTPNLEDATKIDGQSTEDAPDSEGEVEVSESGDSEGESLEEDTSVDSSGDARARSAIHQTASIEKKDLQASEETAKQMLLRLEQGGEDEMKTKTVRPGSVEGEATSKDVHGKGMDAVASTGSSVRAPVVTATKVYMTDRQYYDVAYVNSSGVMYKTVGNQRSLPPTATSVADIVHIETQSENAASPASLGTAVQQSGKERNDLRSLPSTEGLTPTALSSVQALPDKTMKVTIQLPKAVPGKTSMPQPKKWVVMHGTVSSDSGEPPPGISKVPARVKSLPRDPKAVTPEMLHDRITKLISANAAIIDTPMADAPRPKRLSRQNSEVTALSRSDSVIQLQSGPLSRADSLAQLQSASLSRSDSMVQVPVSSGTVLQRAPVVESETNTSVGDVELVSSEEVIGNTGMSTPESKRIQIPLVRQNSQQQHGSIIMDTVAPESEERSEKSSGATVGGHSATVTSSVAQGPPSTMPQEIKIQIKLHKPKGGPVQPGTPTGNRSGHLQSATPIVGQPMIGQPGVQFIQAQLPKADSVSKTTQNPEGSVIKDLLLKGRTVQPPAVNTNIIRGMVPTSSQEEIQTVVLSPTLPTKEAEGPFIPGVREEVSGVRHVVIDGDVQMTPSVPVVLPHTSQEAGPLHIAQDVEVSSSIAASPHEHDTNVVESSQSGKKRKAPSESERIMGLSSITADVHESDSTNTAELSQSKKQKSPSEQEWIIEPYDPNMPRKKGRPKGSKNRPKGAPHFGGAPITNLTPIAPNIQGDVNAGHVVGGPGSPRILLPHATPGGTSSQAASPLQPRPSLQLNIPRPIAPSFTPDFSSSIQSQTGSVMTSSPQTGTPQPDTPTTQSLWKLKLKGKLLMRRSMSQERMLSQEKVNTAGKIPNSPLTMQNRSHPLVQASPLVKSKGPIQRSESVEYPSLAKRPRLVESHSVDEAFNRTLHAHMAPELVVRGKDGSSGGALCKLVPTSQGSQNVSIRPNVEVKLSASGDACKKQSDSGISLAETVVVPSETTESVLKRNPVTIPYNQCCVVLSNTEPLVSPLVNSKIPKSDRWIDVPPNISSRSPIAKQLSRLRSRMEAKAETQSSLDVKDESMSETVVEDSTKGKNFVGVGSHRPILKSQSMDDSKLSIREPRKPDVPAIEESPQESEQEGRILIGSVNENKTPAQQLVQSILQGHSRPSLDKNNIHATFCCVFRPQPMYVQQGNSQKISMYSNWRVARYNPNPQGLSSRMLLSLYKSRRYNSPHGMFASCDITEQKSGILTHSSYWNYYNKLQATKSDEVATVTESKFAKPEERDMYVIVTDGEQILTEPQSVMTISTDPNIQEQYKGTIISSNQPKRVRIFQGGFKSNEEYIYVRGRGRGKYVCEECGIRCKKPSMLKKHLRTHTDVRPFTCKHCNFSFKTKGNLTKHMKSKAHHKKCLELGVVPIPITVDESQIDAEALAKQTRISKEAKIFGEDSSLNLTDEEEEDEDMDEDGDEDDDDEDQPVIITETVSIPEEQEIRSQGHTVVAMATADGQQPEVIRIRVAPDGSQLVSESQHPSSLSTVYGIMQTATIVAEGSDGSAEGLSAEGKLPDDLDTRRAIDDEVARSLLDLSKQGQGNQPKLLRQHSAPAGALGPKVVASNPNRLDSLIGALMNRTNKGEADKSKGYQVHTIHPYSVGKDLSSIPVKKRLLRLSQGSEEKGEVYLVDCSSDTLDKVGHMTTPAGGSRMSTTLQAVTSQMSSKAVYKEVLPSDLGHSSRKSGATYAQKIAALQSANENDLRRSLGRSSISASSSTTSGFVPPILQGMLPVLVNPLGSTLSMSDEGGKSDKSASVEVRSVVSDKGTTGPTFQFTHPFQSTSVGLQSKDQGSQEIKIKDLLLVDSRGQRNSEHEEIREQTEGTRNAVPDENQEDQDQQKYSRSRSTSTDDRMSSGSKSPTSPTGSDGQGVMFTITSSGRIETVHGSTAGLATSQVQYVTGDNRAPYEIMPIPGKVREGADEMVDGKFVCNICRKSFTHQHQLVLHKNIHYFERQFRCEDCGISFRTKGHLVKHQRSESHHTKQNLKQHFGVATMENPRPFKCDDCKVAFRIHGHLAKHLRSKMHIATLERLGKVPPGTYAQIEKGDLTNIDATDCETSLESIQSMIDTANTGSLVQNIESDNVDDQDEPRSPMECDAGITIVSVSSLTGQTGTTSSDRLTAQATSPIREQFHLHSAGGYEKDDRASNERVTVEIKSEPIDLGDIYPSGSRQPHFGEEAEGEHVLSGRTADKSEGTNGRDEPQKSPHKCGMCGKTFKAMSSLKQHLVSHAELRPYVCEYCDAGFTTAQSLKFHLRTHTQERPYICGQCGDTFARSDHLKQHMRVHNRVPKSPGLQASSTTQVASRGPAPVSVSGASTLQRIPSHVDSTGAVKCSNVAGSQSQSMVVMLANQGGKVGENCMVPQETSDTHEQELPSLMATADGTNKKDTKSPSGEQQVYMILTEDGSLMELEASALSMEDQHKLGLLDDDASGGEGTQMMYVVMADDAEVSADSLQDIVQQVAALPGQPSTGQVLDQSAVEQVHVPQTVQCEGASHQPVQRQALIKPGAEQRLVRQQAVDQHTLPPQAIEQQGIDHLEIRQGNLEQQAAQQQSIEHQATEQDNMQHEAPKQQTIADAQHERLQHQARKQHSAGQAVDLGKLQFQEVKQQSTGYVSEKQQRLEPQNTEKESTDHTTPEEKQNQEAVQQSTSPQAMEKLSMQQQASGAESLKEERTGLAAQQGAVQMTTQQDNIGQVLEEMPMATKSFDAVEDTAEEKCRTADESAETVICTEHSIQTVNGGLKTQSLLVNQQAAIVEIESPDIVVNMEQGGDTGDIHVQGQKPSAEESVEAEDVTLEVSKSEGGVNMEGASNKEEHVDTNYQHEAHCDINFKNVHRFGCAGSVDGNVDPTKGTDKSTESDSKTPRLNNQGTELPGAESADQQVLPSSGKNNGLDEVCTGAGLCVNIESSEKTANTQINSASDPSQVQVKDNTQDLENTKGAENLVMGTNVSGEKNRSQREAGEEDHGKRMQNFTEEMEVDSVGQMTQEVLPVMVQNMQSDQEDSRSVEVMECNTAEATTAALTESTNQQVSDHGDVTMETSHVEYKSPASNDSFELVLEDLSEDDPS